MNSLPLYADEEIQGSKDEIEKQLMPVLHEAMARLGVPSFIIDLNVTKDYGILISDLHPFSHTVHRTIDQSNSDRAHCHYSWLLSVEGGQS